MSLKAKIEAVIYAAEEPVTLQQLVSLFGEEAAAELARRHAAQGRLALGFVQAEADGQSDQIDANDPEALNAEVMEAVLAADEVDDPPTGSGAREQDLPERESTDGDSAEQQTSSTQEPRSDGAPDDVADGGREPDAAEAERRREERERTRKVRDLLRLLLEELMREYATSERGLEIREVAGGFRLATKPEYHDAVRGFARTLKPPLKLSLQALETLAVVAYKQPVTAPEVSEIRGVDSGGVLGSLMGRKLVATAGRKQVVGRPILYKTTKEFLLRFGLKDISELPSIEEFERMAGELAQEEIPMAAGNGTMDGTDPTFPGAVSPGLTEPGSDQVGVHDGGGPVDSPPEQTPATPGGFTEPQADGDPGETVTPQDAPPLDGRLAGLDPPDAEPGGDLGTDSPALDAEIQGDERSGA